MATSKGIVDARRNPFARQKKDPSEAPEPPAREDLVQSLRAFDAPPVIDRYQRELAGRSPANIVQEYSFGSSIYRAFRHESPTSRYREWRWYSRADELMEKMNGLESQTMFDELAYSVAGSLVDDWGEKKDDGRPTYMNMGIAMKITNLILKHLAFSEHCDNERVEQWLHVPWDKYTLEPLQDIWTGQPAIRNKARQGFVDNLELYRRLHRLITDIANEAGVARIVYEFWGWDRAH